MSKGVKLLAALMDDEGGNGQHLLGAAKNLACAVSDMLKTAQPTSTEVRQRTERWVVSELFVFQMVLQFCCHFSLDRICSRLQETWARLVESCCPTLERLTLILSSRFVIVTLSLSTWHCYVATHHSVAVLGVDLCFWITFCMFEASNNSNLKENIS